MSTPTVRPWSHADYERAAREYEAKLPLEHYMEATPQATQRAITLASLTVVRGRLRGLHIFNELLVQFFFEGQIRQVVPDNMVVFGELDERERASFAPDLEKSPPFWMLEYVSPRSHRKDYAENMRVYEQELRVPYYLVFDPERQDLRLFKLNGQYYQRQPGLQGRLSIPELEVEVAILNRWVRFWFRGRLLGLPDELDARATVVEQALEKALRLLRPVVEQKARAAGRQDVLQRLPAVNDVDEMERLLAELGG